MIQAIVYDAVGTLMHVHPSVEAIYADVGRRFGSRLEPDEIRHRFRAAFADEDRVDEAAGWRTDEARERERWRTIVGRVLDDVRDVKQCFEALFAAFAQPAVWTFDPDWPRVFEFACQHGLRQIVASNFDQRLHNLIRAMPHAEHIERVIVSSEVGWRKPAREFFAHVIQALSFAPDHILFVGDDRANDYDAACAAGMQALLVDDRASLARVIDFLSS